MKLCIQSYRHYIQVEGSSASQFQTYPKLALWNCYMSHRLFGIYSADISVYEGKWFREPYQE